ncbi:hypothetical protein C8J57DRAFT_1506148 [Mycena rebaudengoi]|nr:hypothetical protein C8J57DRAFT_1506148 [Mycena rebaudengoi]
MFSSSTLSFMAFVAAASFKLAMSVRVPTDLATGNHAASIDGAGGPSPNTANVVLCYACADINFGGCVSLNFGSVPTGCIGVPGGFNDVASSARAVDGVLCTFFEHAGCGGRSVVIAGNVANFVDIGFNDLLSSFSCIGT